MLLRSHDRRPQVRDAQPGAHHQLPAGGGRKRVQRLREMRQCLPGGSHDAGLDQRSAASQDEKSQSGRRPVPGMWRVRAHLHQRWLSLRSRPERVITPLNSTHRVVMMAIERGNLQDLIFDNRVLWNHRALAAVLGVILRLPPLKRAMASEQFKSRYVETLITRFGYR